MNKSIATVSSILLSLLNLTGCGSNSTVVSNQQESIVLNNDSGSKISPQETASPSEVNQAKEYNYLDKVSGTYKVISEAPDYIKKSITIQITGKRIIVDGEKLSYEVGYEKKDTVLRLRKVSEDSGDFLGGGDLLVNGSRIQYKMLYGPEANEEYIFEKKNN